jgi:hypothetical protein
MAKEFAATNDGADVVTRAVMLGCDSHRIGGLE